MTITRSATKLAGNVPKAQMEKAKVEREKVCGSRPSLETSDTCRYNPRLARQDLHKFVCFPKLLIEIRLEI